MTEKLRPLDLKYRDPHGVIVHVIAFDSENQRVIYMREGYEHECTKPVKHFKKHFTKVSA